MIDDGGWRMDDGGGMIDDRWMMHDISIRSILE